MEQHQKELEIEFEARFPALYKKAQAMRPAATYNENPSPPPGSPPPPFHSEPRRSQSFRDVDWTRPRKEDDVDFDIRKAPLVGPLASGLEKMREAGNLHRSESSTSFRPYSEDYPVKGNRDIYADDYDHDYDEIDPKSEGLGNEPGFQQAGVPATSESATGSNIKGPEKGDDTFKKGAKKRPQLWDRLRSGGTR